MAGTDAILTLPDASVVIGPVDPRTWAAGDRGRAKQLTRDVAAAVAWHRNRPFFQGLQTASASVPASSWTALNLDWEMLDPWGGHSGSGELWYPPFTAVAGSITDYYLCSGYVPVSGSDTTKVAVAGLIRNGSDIREGTKLPLNSAHVIDPMVIDLIGVQGGIDTISLGCWTNISGGVSTVVSAKCPSLTARWVGSAVGTVSPLPPVPHSWIPADQLTATATGASPVLGGSKVPLNAEIRDLVRFLNYPPLARLTSQGTSQTIPTGGAFTSIQFPTKDIDTYSGWSSGANTKYTIQRAGLYVAAGYASVAEVSASGGYRAVRLLVNGTTPYGGTSSIPTTSGTTGTALYAVRHLRLAAGDTVEVQLSNTGSSALPVTTAAGNSSRLIMVWRGR